MSRRRFLPVVLSLLSAGNLAAIYAAVESATPDPMHATLHGVLAVGFAAWAQWAWLRWKQTAPALNSQERIEGVEADIDSMRQELLEAQERLDFAERMLAQQSREQLPRER